MKRILKQIVLVSIMLCLVMILTGCGNKLVATKDMEENGIKYKLEYVAKFKNNKVETIKITSEYEDEENAEEMYSVFNLMNAFAESEEDKMDVVLEGKKVIMNLNAIQFAELEGDTEVDLSKEGLKKSLEEQGFKVK